jgi:hypothetical protein
MLNVDECVCVCERERERERERETSRYLCDISASVSLERACCKTNLSLEI